MTTDGDRATEAVTAARQAADAASVSAIEIIRMLDNIHTKQEETRGDILRVETVAIEARDQAKRTNGRVTTLELWRAEVRGMAQGVGGSGRLLMYCLTSAAAGGGLIVALLTVATHLTVK